MDVVRRERRREQPGQELAHLVGLEVLAGFDGGAAGVRRREPLQPIGEPAKSPAREIGDELSEAAGRIEAGMRARESPANISSGTAEPPVAAQAPSPESPAPSGAAATRGPSAARTASSTTFSTKNLSRKRTSSFDGWTFTSTASPGSSKNRMSDGRSPGATVER